MLGRWGSEAQHPAMSSLLDIPVFVDSELPPGQWRLEYTDGTHKDGPS
jgi:hypothetical protein